MNAPPVRGAVVLLAPWIIAFEAPSTAAQVNIESLRSGDTPPGMSGSLGMDLSVRTGNVEIVEIKPNGRVAYAGAHLTTTVIASASFGWQGGERFSMKRCYTCDRCIAPKHKRGLRLLRRSTTTRRDS